MWEALLSQNKILLTQAREEEKQVSFHYIDRLWLIRQHEVRVDKIDYFEIGEHDFFGIQGYCHVMKKDIIFELEKLFDLKILTV